MFTKLIKRGLAVLGLATVATTGTPVAARSTGPALWEVSDKDTTIYLFGTIHLLPKNSRWRTPKFEKALAGSQSLVLETLIDSANPQQLAGVMASMSEHLLCSSPDAFLIANKAQAHQHEVPGMKVLGKKLDTLLVEFETSRKVVLPDENRCGVLVHLP